MWEWLVWGALAAMFIAILGGLVFVAVRGLRAWRDVKRFRRHGSKAFDHLTVAAAEMAEKAAARVEGAEELQRSAARLQRSLAELAVLRRAVEEAQDTLAFPPALLARK